MESIDGVGSLPFDKYTDPPSAGSSLVLHGGTATPTELIIHEILKEKENALYVGGNQTNTSIKLELARSILNIDLNSINYMASIDEILTGGQKSYDVILLDGAKSLLEQYSSEKVPAAITELREYAIESNSFIFWHCYKENSSSKEILQLNRLSDLVSEVLEKEVDDGFQYEFVIKKNRYGKPMTKPAPLNFDYSVDIDTRRGIG